MHRSSTTTGSAPTSHKWIPRIAFVLLAGITGVAAAVGMQHGGGEFGGWHHGGGDLNALANPADRAAHVDKMLQHLYTEIDATDEQKRRLEPIFKRAADELIPIHQEMRSTHTVAHELLSKDRVDRLALESARQEHMQMADQGSRILVAFVADVADVLTPAQRKILLERMQQHQFGGHG